MVGKLLLQFMIFKNDIKELELTPKLENMKNFPKIHEENCSNHFFMMSALFRQKFYKMAQLR